MRSEAVKLARRLLMPVFARVNPGDITIRHHHTGDAVRLHSFRHKGYWWYGKKREAETMALFAKLIRPGDTVFDVGGHIGYVALYFRRLVGPAGQVIVFEPGANNLPYLRRNLSPYANIELVEAGVGDRSGKTTFHLEDLTGQNNSFVNDFEGYRANAEYAFRAPTKSVEVEILTLDEFVRGRAAPDFLKIDVEGFEYEVLRGGREMLAHARPMIMVEVQRNQKEVLELLTGLGYKLFHPMTGAVRAAVDLQMNTFCLHPEKHANALKNFAA